MFIASSWLGVIRLVLRFPVSLHLQPDKAATRDLSSVFGDGTRVSDRGAAGGSRRDPGSIAQIRVLCPKFNHRRLG
ncbi:hypothetical protein N657DRAFT_87445 [Parathielavia appendiculata]|uniref:Secreted protein n=1 Tax=Parathielavia appendiculata TaxID=2587402 RepID=A0AAN6UAV2_9PEZI|nr:hypothetical protein N657DRAFT_87445 [Parathielavia appendiculata]